MEKKKINLYTKNNLFKNCIAWAKSLIKIMYLLCLAPCALYVILMRVDCSYTLVALFTFISLMLANAAWKEWCHIFFLQYNHKMFQYIQKKYGACEIEEKEDMVMVQMECSTKDKMKLQKGFPKEVLNKVNKIHIDVNGKIVLCVPKRKKEKLGEVESVILSNTYSEHISVDFVIRS